MTRLRIWWDSLLYTLWFVPALMVVGAAALAVVLIIASGHVDDEVLARWPRLFGADAGSSRDMLATIAGSIITVAGVTFSITMITVTQASAQYTPRILRNFMRDRPSQVTLGGLAGVFTYCLVVLRTIRGGDESLFVPALAVLTGFILAVVSVGLLIYFVHHTASSLQASSIIDRVVKDTYGAIDRLFPSEVGDAAAVDAVPAAAHLLDTYTWLPVTSSSSGYVQAIDPDALLDAASERNIVIRVERTIGQFVIEGGALASIATRDGTPTDPRPAGIRSAFTVGNFRTVEQDPDYGIHQLSDIAVKALSPSINDPTTALSCIDYLAAALSRAAALRSESPWRVRDGELRVIVHGPTFRSLLDRAFDEIRRYGEGNAAVLHRLLDALERLERRTGDPGRRRHLLMHVELVTEAAGRALPAPGDRGGVSVRAAALRSVLT
ncbi:MAG: DUF2254 domain-containing protein [Gemmatimonadaceae bacterium]|nr:DUF2254 domain-containing protein [Gemmatimonadaceae bacterium]